jgi:chromosome segregation protein
MRLTTIKLSGFKSFVDPTVLHLETNYTGIVGPNGCGKSNIIDAIRWVMGETAASRLRGDAITDVIFSGSSARKPVGAATVELLFDNSDGTIVGEYAKFNEISVKRVVSRDGQSSYFLNGTRCRRRDIIDVFLGTGLGARSYSIIEQGMISQIVEARPEELRTHLEEAAGISKYKERRKETESRIKSTRENLERLKDVRDEVDKQIDHLNRQARAAERWQKLKAEAARVEAELKALALKKQELDYQQRNDEIGALELTIEKGLTELRAVEAKLEAFRERQNAATERFNEVQAQVYRVGADLARVEQQIQHSRELSARLTRAGDETRAQLTELEQHAKADADQITLLRDALAVDEPRIETLLAEADERNEAMRNAEQALTAWQQRWDDYARHSSEAARAAEVERTRLDYLDKQSVDFSRRLEQLERERANADLAGLTAQAEGLSSEHDSTRSKVDTLGGLLEERRAAMDALAERQKQVQGEVAQTRQRLEAARGRLASLEALQHAALGQEQGALSDWLKSHGLGSAKRLGEVLDVADGWERAVETVLAGLLDATLCPDPNGFADALATVDKANVALIDEAGGGHGMAGTLASQVRGPAAVLALLSKVRIADSVQQAHDAAARLPAGESVITADGVWLAAGLARVVRAGGAQVGVIAREREIHTLQTERDTLEARLEELVGLIDDLKAQFGEAEMSRDDAQRELYASHRRLSELAGQLQSHQGRYEAAQQRMVKIEQECSALIEQRDVVESDVRDARGRLDTAVERMGDLEAERAELDGMRRKLLEQREEARFAAREAADAAHQVQLRIESKRAALASLEQAVSRMEQQRSQLAQRAEEIAGQLETGDAPIAQLEEERRTYLDQRLLVDKDLVAARKALEELDQETRQDEVERHRIDGVLSALREQHSGLRLAAQRLRFEADTYAKAIAEAGFDVAAIEAELAPEADADTWKARLEDLDGKIKRLEPVNLAAISEHAEQSQRKGYLDTQFGDLTAALETLEGAIKKIDRETRTRFKETFDKVNSGLNELFPTLFGGGHAYLELTGNDLLDTGVSIMARPPGKRVTSISLLSGGEKALTAVALVFAIFRLNPAPFCLLDEVDAPLDEANVGRFSSMVQTMAENVQFIVVTHNKTTMEAARQLCGVTMREPGVSRLVQVDLAEAAKLVGAA